MNSLLADLMQSLRLLRKFPAFAATVIVVLALGVGANTAIFSVIHGVLLHPFPYQNSERIVFIGTTREAQQGFMPVTYPDYLDLRKQSEKFAQLAFATNRGLTLTEVAEPANLGGAAISASAWPLLGLAPTLGRTFTEAEDHPGATPVCVISSSLWKGRLGGDPAILGRTLMLDARPTPSSASCRRASNSGALTSGCPSACRRTPTSCATASCG